MTDVHELVAIYPGRVKVVRRFSTPEAGLAYFDQKVKRRRARSRHRWFVLRPASGGGE